MDTRLAHGGLVHVVRETFDTADGPYSFLACGWVVMVSDGRAYLHGARTHAMEHTNEVTTCLWCVTKWRR